MPNITVITGGPIDIVPEIVEPRPRSMEQLLSTISDIIDDVQNEYNMQIINAITASIRFCERDVFYFNEARDLFIMTQAGIAEYEQPRLIDVKTVCLEGSGYLNKIRYIEPSDSLGPPKKFACFGGSIFLYPTPDKEYTIRAVSVPARIEDMAYPSAPNIWFIHAFDMIKARALYELFSTVLNDDAQEQKYYAKFQEEYNALKAETSRRNGSGFITPAEF